MYIYAHTHTHAHTRTPIHPARNRRYTLQSFDFNGLTEKGPLQILRSVTRCRISWPAGTLPHDAVPRTISTQNKPRHGSAMMFALGFSRKALMIRMWPYDSGLCKLLQKDHPVKTRLTLRAAITAAATLSASPALAQSAGGIATKPGDLLRKSPDARHCGWYIPRSRPMALRREMACRRSSDGPVLRAPIFRSSPGSVRKRMH